MEKESRGGKQLMVCVCVCVCVCVSNSVAKTTNIQRQIHQITTSLPEVIITLQTANY